VRTRWLVFTLGLAASGCYLSHEREDPCAEGERCAVVAWRDHPSAEVLGGYEAPGGAERVDHEEGRRRVEAAVGRAGTFTRTPRGSEPMVSPEPVVIPEPAVDPNTDVIDPEAPIPDPLGDDLE
jgi:hypothetical protein